MKDLVIVGVGGFAKEVAWLVERINTKQSVWNFIGFIDNDVNQPNVIGNDDYVLQSGKELYVAIAIGFSEIRERLYNKYKENPNVKFANLIDPSVILSNRVMLGEGNIVCAGAIITVDVSIGNCNIINLDCTVGHDAIIEDCVTINPSVNVSGHTRICSGCNIGTGTQIIQGLTIGKDTIVGAGAVVNKNLPEYSKAVGVPARVITCDNKGRTDN